MMRPAALALAVMCVCACRSATIVPEAPHARRDVIALLPDPETMTVGHAVVSSPVGGSVELTSERAATRVAVGQPPGALLTLTEVQVQQLFGDALAARPPAPRHFLLYFESGSNQLTPESEGVVIDLLAFVKTRVVPDVTVAGHTDTTGAAHANIELGRRRASMIRDRLVATGLDGQLVSVASHGEADPLVPTPDEAPDPRNRRVEVSVR